MVLGSPRSLAVHAKNADRILYNWSGLQYIADKAKVVHPRTEEELAAVVKQTRKVRIIGTALSYEAISSVGPAQTSTTTISTSSTSSDSSSSVQDGKKSSSSNLPSPPLSPSMPKSEDDIAVISLQHEFTGLKSIDTIRNTATFRAATPIDDVIAILAQHGYMMNACPGVIGVQTLAGSIATGTHGQGLYQSDYADMVQSFRIVLADGSIKHMSPATTSPHLFNLYLVSVGTLGIFTEIEIAIRPRLLYTCTKFSCPYDQFLKNYVRWNEESEFAKVWWFPETNMCQVWLVNPSNEQEVVFYNEHRKTKGNEEPQPVEYTVLQEDHSGMNQTIQDYIHAMAKDTDVSQHSGEPQFSTLTRFMNMQTVIGWNEQLVTKGIPVPQINCEISIPLHRFQEATEALREWQGANPGKLHYPFIYRVAGQSKALLSASHRGPVVWIGFLVYISQSGAIRNDGMNTMYEIQKTLAPFQGLPHWGKHYHPELFEMAKLYTASVWNRFRQEMRNVDPLGKLTSPFLHNIFFGPPPRTNIIESKL